VARKRVRPASALAMFEEKGDLVSTARTQSLLERG
jgi:hypothetical protein